MSVPTGKGIFIWQINSTGYDDDEQLADVLAANGFSHVTFKGLGGKSVYFPNKYRLPVLVPLLKARGIQVRIYQYVYGVSVANAKAEAAAAVAYINELGFAGLEIDAEKEYNQLATQAQAKEWAIAYMAGLNALPVGVSVSLCSYRYPSVQPHFPWSQFLNHPRLDFVMPQVYWQGAILPASAGWQLTKSKAEYDALAPSLPYVPVGSAYCEHGWCSSPAQVQNFSDMAKTLALSAISFWSMQHLPTISNMQETVFALDWPVTEPPVEPPPVEPPPFPKSGTVNTTDGLWLRGFPESGANPIYKMLNKTKLTIHGEIPHTNGYEWWIVRDEYGFVGCCAKNWVTISV